ncbi:hypothetical protein OIY81_2953 [Cryptosporidium canis]|nr:hypothetical protein OIY81_2953 [Cryptosporidium canis]
MSCREGQANREKQADSPKKTPFVWRRIGFNEQTYLAVSDLERFLLPLTPKYTVEETAAMNPNTPKIIEPKIALSYGGAMLSQYPVMNPGVLLYSEQICIQISRNQPESSSVEIMATINNTVFMSDDEEDESFHGSDASSSVESESSEEESSSTLKKASLKEVMNSRRVDKVYDEILRESRREFEERVCTVQKDHFMLEFQKKCFDSSKKKNSDLQALKHYVDLGPIQLQFTSVPHTANVLQVSKVFENPVEFDISKFKASSRNLSKESEAETRRMVEQAIGGLEEKGAKYIDKKVKYAGQTYTIKERVDPETFSRKKARASLTGVQALDDIVASINKEISINSIQKSQSDWTEFRQMAGLESQLERQRKHGYISKAAFLQKADWKLHEKELEIRRRGANSSSSNSGAN